MYFCLLINANTCFELKFLPSTRSMKYIVKHKLHMLHETYEVLEDGQELRPKHVRA